jgi:hypothetical protein
MTRRDEIERSARAADRAILAVLAAFLLLASCGALGVAP